MTAQVHYKDSDLRDFGARLHVSVGCSPCATDCSEVELTFWDDLNWGIEVGNQQGEARIFHSTDVTRMDRPDSLRIFVEGKTNTRLLAAALIFAGQTIFEQLGQGGNIVSHDGEYTSQLRFPWNMDQKLYRVLATGAR